jgi:hypothetical protein
MAVANIIIHDRNAISMDSFTNAERERLLSVVEELSRTPRDRWPEKGVRPLKPREELYLVPAGLEDLLIVFSVSEEGQFVVEHIFRQAAVDFFTASLHRKARKK